MGPRSHPFLERPRMVGPSRAGGGAHRPSHRGASRFRGRRRHHHRRRLQGGRRSSPPAPRPPVHPHRHRQLPHRPLRPPRRRRPGRRRSDVGAPDQVLDRISPDVAVVSLTHVDYRTGRRHSIPDVDAAARDAGALVVWDLSHSVGAMDVDMSGSDFAVGCGYKYLNGGPGAPAFIYVHPSHQAGFRNPITGWWGHAEPFAMESAYRPAPGASRAQTGTQSILALVALDAALDVFDGVDTRALRVK